MGSPINTIVASLYMKDSEIKAIIYNRSLNKIMKKICGWHICGAEYSRKAP